MPCTIRAARSPSMVNSAVPFKTGSTAPSETAPDAFPSAGEALARVGSLSSRLASPMPRLAVVDRLRNSLRFILIPQSIQGLVSCRGHADYERYVRTD